MILRAMHLLAVVIWAGGMIFFTLVVMPSIRRGLAPSQRQELIQVLGRRYRVMGWASIAVLLITGSLMTWHQGVAWDSGFGRILILKLILVGIMLALTSLHDFVLGPRVAKASNPHHATWLRRAVIYLARLNLLVVLGIVLCGVWLTTV